MQLIPEWRSALKLFSVQVNIIGAALATTYATMYAELKETVPPQWMAVITVGVFLVSSILRVISQQSKDGDETTDR